LLISLYFTFGCQDQEAISELKMFKTQAETVEQNKVLIRNFFKEWNNRNIDILSEMHATNAKYHHPSVGSSSIPVDEMMESVNMLWKAFPDITVDIEDLFAEGDKVVVRFIGRGTHQEDFGGIPANGVKTEASAMEIFHIVDGKIMEVWEISDRLGLMQQLGLELKPK
jgi:steroid delta-isomerase-like uncharacterized protein